MRAGGDFPHTITYNRALKLITVRGRMGLRFNPITRRTPRMAVSAIRVFFYSRLCLPRQANREGGPALLRRLDIQRAIVRMHDLIGDIETEAEVC